MKDIPKSRSSLAVLTRVIIVILFMIETSNAQVWTEFLAGRTINAIVWDNQRRLLWFATLEDGVISFDGTNFTDFNTVTTDGKLATNALTTAVIDKDGDLWFGTGNDSLIRFKPDSSQWQTYTTADGLLPSYINALAVDIDGAIWIGTNESGVNRFDRYTQWDTFTTNNGLSSDMVLSIAIDPEGNKWFGTAGGLDLLKNNGEWGEKYLSGSTIDAVFIDTLAGKRDKWFAITPPNLPQGSNDIYLLRNNTSDPQSILKPGYLAGFTSIITDEEGRIWFGAYYGAGRLDPSEPDSSMWKEFVDSENISGRYIRTMALDEDGNLWFGAINYGGAVKFNTSLQTFDELDGLGSAEVTSLAEDHSGTIWAGTLWGLSKLNSTHWETFFGDTTITIVAVDSNSIWVGTDGDGIIKLIKGEPFADTTFYSANDPTNDLANNFINDIIFVNNDVWIATEEGLNRFKPKTGEWETFRASDTTLIDNRVKTLAIQDETILWCGTRAGVSRYNIISNKWQNFTTKNGLSGNWITDILVDKQNDSVWFATDGNGVNIYLNGSWQKPFTVADGLADNFVNVLVESLDPIGIWFGTRNGASFKDSDDNWTTFGKQNGLAGNQIESMLRDNQHNIWYGTRASGLTRYKRKTNRPRTHLVSSYDITTSTEILYKFIGSDHGTPTPMLRYTYKLDDQDFSPYTFDTFTRISIPSNGLHTFYVKTIDSDGNESPEATDSFYKISPNKGVTTTLTDTSRIFGLDSVRITLYWPPYQLPDTTQVTVTIQPVPIDSLGTPALFAYDLKPFGLNIREKGIILSFAVNKSSIDANENYSIYREKPDGTILGGTVTIDHDTFRITTSIDQFGRYLLRASHPEVPITARGGINAQPRIFSPNGDGHGRETTISFELPEPSHARIRVYNLAGRLVNTIWDEPLNAGVNAIVWNGKDRNSQICPTGLYIITVESSKLNATKKVMVLNK